MFSNFSSNSYFWLVLIVSVICIIITAFLWYLRRNDNYWAKRNVIFYPRMSIIEIIRLLSTKSLQELWLMPFKKYGRLFGSFSFSTPVLFVGDPEHIRHILVKDFHIFNNRLTTSLNDPLIDNMVSLLKGEDWKRVRTIITPAFTSKQMRRMSHIINGCSKTVLDVFEKHAHYGKPVDCKESFGAFVTDVIALSAFATKLDSINDPNNIFVKMLKETTQERSLVNTIFLSLIHQRLLKYFRVAGFKSMYFFKQVVLDVMKKRKASGQKFDDLLQTLMDAVKEEIVISKEMTEDDADQYGSISSSSLPTLPKYKTLTEDELVAQCVLFFFAGFETTAATLSFMAYALATNPDWQEKLIDEVDKAFLIHEEMSYDAVRNMKILDAVISETLRMYPPAVLLTRVPSEDYKLGNTGIVIEKGMSTFISVYATHFDPEFFPEPDKFNPERFFKSENQSHPQYSYLPFGEGPRNCLGMRFALLGIKICMVNILRHYKFKVGPTTKVPIEFKKFSLGLSVSSLPLVLEKRT